MKNKESKEKTILQKIAGIFNEVEGEQVSVAPVEETVVEEENTEVPAEVVNEQQVIAVGLVLALPAGIYTTEEGTKFVVKEGVITEIVIPEATTEEEAPAEEAPAEAPASEMHDERFSAIEQSIQKLTEAIKIIGSQPVQAKKVQRKEVKQTSNTPDTSNLKKYFKSENDFQAFLVKNNIK